jgi:hypothetical protein
MPATEQRAQPRYAAHPPLRARFGANETHLVNLSVAGAMLQHREPLSVATEAPLQIDAEGVELHAEVVWTRRMGTEEPAAWLSGLRFVEWVEVAQHAIERLVASGAVRLDASAPPTRAEE